MAAIVDPSADAAPAEDAAAARADKLKSLMDRSKQRDEDKKTLQNKLMMKLYLEGLKAKTRKKAAAEAEKAAAATAAPERAAAAAAAEPVAAEPVAAEPVAAAAVAAADLAHAIGGDAPATARACAASLRSHGCALLASGAAIPPATIAACRRAADAALADTLRELEARGIDASGVKTKEIVQRNAGRYDLVRGVEGAEPFGALGRGGPWMPTVKRTLGVACALLKTGVVYALPGAALQSIHADGKHLYDGDGDVADDAHLPAHCVTVFVPLLDLSPELGPTEYFPGTHRRDGDRARYERAHAGREAGVAFAGAKAGDAILFDYRVLHRGLANTSTEARPLLYFTYGRPWFTDATNYSALSIFDE